jgi:hypothetical protein
LFDVKDTDERITMVNGKIMKGKKVRSLKCQVVQLDGSSVDVTLKEVKYVPDLWVLFSASTMH